MKDDEGLLRSVYTFVPNLRRASGRALSVYLPARAEGFDLRHYDIEVGQLRRRYTEQLDKEHARLFAAVLDDVYPLEQVHGVAVKRNKAGGTSAPSNQRKADNRTKANLERVIDVIGHEVQSGAFRQIFVAGPEEARAELERLMPPPLKRLLAGHLSAEIDSRRLQHELRERLVPARPI